MKRPFNTCKPVAILVSAFFLLTNSGYAQKNGMLPLTGMKFYSEGISAKLISVGWMAPS